MAKENMVQAGQKQDIAQKTIARKAESLYSRNELAQSSIRLFGVMPECVEAALKSKNIKESTVENAKKIVSEFMKKEVK